MNITIVGGTGFVGRALIGQWERFSPGGWIRVLSRRKPGKPLPANAEWLAGSIMDPESLSRALEGADAVFHLTGILAETRTQTYEKIHVEGTRNLIERAKALGVRRAVYVSAIGASRDAVSRYHRTKFQAEDLFRWSGLDVTTFRPSVIFGPGDRFVSLFAAMGKKFHVLPVVGPGTNRIHPVYVGDLAQAMALSAERPETIGRTYSIGGPRIYTYRELMETFIASLHLKALILPQPPALLGLGATLQEWILPVPFLTREMIKMALEDNIAMPNDLSLSFNLNPMGLEAYLESDLYRRPAP